MPGPSSRLTSALPAVLILLTLLTAGVHSADQPNMVLILSDNQSYYEMSCHGHVQIKTPDIDAPAKEGISDGHLWKVALGFSYPNRPQGRGFEMVSVHCGGGVEKMEDFTATRSKSLRLSRESATGVRRTETTASLLLTPRHNTLPCTFVCPVEPLMSVTACQASSTLS